MFNLIRHELNKLETLPPWGRPQGDQWDQLSSFVYQVKTLQGVQRQARAVAQAQGMNIEAFAAYALRRWYNHHTHNQILQIFCDHPDVKPEENNKHHSIDFYLRDIPFDLKISTFPKAYPESLKYAWQHRQHLALWQYENQSKQGRYHASNRLFLILHHRAQPELSWQLRRDFEPLERLVHEFLTAPVLLGLTLTHPKTGDIHQPWTALIFHIK